MPFDTLSKPGENPISYLDLRARSASYPWRLRTSPTTGNGRCTDVYNTIGEGGPAGVGVEWNLQRTSHNTHAHKVIVIAQRMFFNEGFNEVYNISHYVLSALFWASVPRAAGEAEEPETRPIQALLMPTAAGGGDKGASHERVPETRQTIDTSINSNAATSATANKSLLLPVQTNIANRPSTFATSDRSFHGLVYPTFERVSAPALGHKPCSEKINDIVGYAPSGSISEATVKDALAAGKDIDAMPAPARRAAPCALSQSFSLQPMVMSSATVSEPLAVAEISRAAASVPLGMREVSNKQVQSSALPTSASILQCASLPSSTRPIRDITQVCLAEDETTSCRNSSKATSQARVEMPREWHVAGNDLSLSPSRDERGKTSRTVSAPQVGGSCVRTDANAIFRHLR